MARFASGIRRLNECVLWAATIPVVAIAILMFSEIVGRAIKVPNDWSTELSVYALIAVNLLTAGAVETNHSQVRFELIDWLIEKAGKRLLKIIAEAICISLSAMLVYVGYKITLQAYELGSISVSSLRAPLVLVNCLLPLGGCLLFLQYLANLILLIIKRFPEARQSAGD
jgi:TRAP-type C4-dicarboxylate transport system permease small subunit